MEEGLFHNQVFVDHVSEFAVAVVGHREAHEEVEQVDPRTGVKRTVCPVYGSIPCQAHQTSMSQARGSFDFSGVPASFVCDSSGKLVSKVSGMAPQKFIEALNEAQQKIGKAPLRGSQVMKMERDLLKGDVALRKGKFGDALESYKEVADDEDVPEFVRKKANKRVEGVVPAALKAIEEAKALDGSKAKRALKKLARECDDIEEAKAAVEEALAELEAE